MPKALLLKPLDGSPAGSCRDFDQIDFDALAKMGAIRAASADKETVQPAADTKMAAPVINKMAPAVANKREDTRPDLATVPVVRRTRDRVD